MGASASFAGQAPPAGSGWDVPLDGEATVHRNVVRQARPAEPPPKSPSKLRRGLLIALLVLVVAGAGTGAYLVTSGDEDDGGGEQTQPSDSTDTTNEDLDLEVPTGLKATESQAGVQLEWDGDNGEQYLVLVLSTAEQPQALAGEMGTSRLVPAEALRPNTGYCFSVALLSVVEAAPQGQAAQAFSSPVCIRGASEDTVMVDPGSSPGG